MSNDAIYDEFLDLSRVAKSNPIRIYPPLIIDMFDISKEHARTIIQKAMDNSQVAIDINGSIVPVFEGNSKTMG